MRVGLTVRGGDGRTLQFIRRKGNRSTLLAADGATPLADEMIQRFLNGLTETEFKSRFALDHDELVEGGKVILQGGGELGAVLFQAGGGLKNLLDVQRELDQEMEDSVQARGLEAADQCRARRAESEERDPANTSLRSAEWLEHETASRRARSRLDEVELELAAKQAARAPAGAAQGGLAVADPAAACRARAGPAWRGRAPFRCVSEDTPRSTRPS